MTSDLSLLNSALGGIRKHAAEFTLLIHNESTSVDLQHEIKWRMSEWCREVSYYDHLPYWSLVKIIQWSIQFIMSTRWKPGGAEFKCISQWLASREPRPLRPTCIYWVSQSACHMVDTHKMVNLHSLGKSDTATKKEDIEDVLGSDLLLTKNKWKTWTGKWKQVTDYLIHNSAFHVLSLLLRSGASPMYPSPL